MSEQMQAAPAAQESAPAENTNQSLESSESSEGQSQVNAEAQIDANPNLTKDQKVEAKKALKSLKIKFNGREIEESLPFEIPDSEEAKAYMTKQLQMSKLAQSKAQEYSQLEQEVRQFVEQLKKNPRKVLSDPNIGIDLKKLAAEMIEEEIENAKKSPEQIEKEKLQARLEELEEERKREQEEFRQREFERLQQQEFERYDVMIGQALEKSDLPKSPYVVKKMADYMLMGLNKGLDIGPADVLPLVREEILGDIKDMFGAMPEEVIEGIVGKDVISRIRKKSVAKAKQNPATLSKSSVKDVARKAAEPTETKKKTIKELFGV